MTLRERRDSFSTGQRSFYVNPASGDYFSVTSGDFTVEAEHRSAFRLDNYDDGSPSKPIGRVSVLHNRTPRALKRPVPFRESGR